MESFSEDHASKLLSKEWLFKVDPSTSTPYLLKFYLLASESPDSSHACCVMVTDTKRVWTEVLTSNEFARRWARCNGGEPSPAVLRRQQMDTINSVHTIGALEECSFESVNSSYSDLAFDIEYTDEDGKVLKWTWETTVESYKSSSQLLSQHLILPLLTLSHMSLSTEEDEDTKDMEKAVDKACRTARRALPIHLKNVFKAKLSTTLSRVTAATNFVKDSELPSISFVVEAPEIVLPVGGAEASEETPAATDYGHAPSASSPSKKHASTPEPEKETSAVQVDRRRSPTPPQAPSPAPMQVDSESATEPETDEELPQPSQPNRRAPTPPSTKSRRSTPPLPPTTTKHGKQKEASRSSSPPPSTTSSKVTHPKPDSDSSAEPKKLTKRAKPAITDSDDSGDEASQSSGTRGAAPKRGTRQPLRRGGKKF